MNIILGILSESYSLLNKMSVYLIFGFIFAGVLHVFLKPDTIARHLGKRKFSSVIKASLFGIPLPLCSCGVIPAALSLRKDGAGKGAVLSFLISTPTTGVDSIFATYALLGPFFAVYRVIASFISGIFAGVMANLFLPDESPSSKQKDEPECRDCGANHKELRKANFGSRIKTIFSYSFGTLLADSGVWILIGIFIGGVIAYFVPSSLISAYLGSPWLSMFIMLIVGIPMYICSAGSIPVVAALMLKGMNPAAAFVFLLAGPATNSVALTVIGKELGKKTILVFLGSVIFCSITLGILLNYALSIFSIDISSHLMAKHTFIPQWLEVAASIILVVGIFSNIFRNKNPQK